MARNHILGPDELMMCPYNNTHLIRCKKFPYHLLKCRKNYRGDDVSTCPFNARHVMPTPELRFHLTTCPDKALVEREMLEKEYVNHGALTIPESTWEDNDPNNENWDAEMEESHEVGTDSSQSGNSIPNLKDLTVLKPSDKRDLKLRLLEISKLQSQERPVKEKKKRSSKHQETSVRLPKTIPLALQVTHRKTQGNIGPGLNTETGSFRSQPTDTASVYSLATNSHPSLMDRYLGGSVRLDSADTESVSGLSTISNISVQDRYTSGSLRLDSVDTESLSGLYTNSHPSLLDRYLCGSIRPDTQSVSGLSTNSINIPDRYTSGSVTQSVSGLSKNSINIPDRYTSGSVTQSVSGLSTNSINIPDRSTGGSVTQSVSGLSKNSIKIPDRYTNGSVTQSISGLSTNSNCSTINGLTSRQSERQTPVQGIGRGALIKYLNMNN